MRFDDSQLLFGKDFEVDEKIKIHHPILKEIFDMGEKKYMSIISLLTLTPADFMSQLFDIGVDYESINEFQLFIMMSNGLEKCDTGIIFGDINFKDFVIAFNEKTKEDVLVNIKDGIVIDRLVYEIIGDFLRKLHNFKKNANKGATPYHKTKLIELHRMDTKMNSQKPYTSMLCPLVSSMVNSKEFKYDYTTVLDLPIYTFMDSVQRVQKIKGCESLMAGMYSGNIDISKIGNKDKLLNWMGDL